MPPDFDRIRGHAPITHTAHCTQARAARGRAQERWKQRWPDHCSFCLARTGCEDPCRHCLASLMCPRCGSTTGIDAEDATRPCADCGWREPEPDDARPTAMACPPEHVCTCRVAAARQAQADIAAAEQTMRSAQAAVRSAYDRLAQLRKGRPR